ncbi:MAG: hypothetical protein DF168_01871 [Candidatus Moanabacter tarae]|uniref:Uncharacterized protein n=1 Tax=Candidatus Moanibacter tarae TaxID=2200854 RepID=A0A2Z4AJQ3_9BACT|nr:MAG: hypothetical protein DF168_01871 [Candidatus Moanabacter tarae]
MCLDGRIAYFSQAESTAEHSGFKFHRENRSVNNCIGKFEVE